MGRESYSPEAQEGAQEERRKAKQALDETYQARDWQKSSDIGEISPKSIKHDLKQDVLKLGDALGVTSFGRAARAIDQADKKLEKLADLEREEVVALRQEHTRLKQEAAAALQALTEFEQSKLGVHISEESGAAEGTLPEV